jgi:hypothetical protein
VGLTAFSVTCPSSAYSPRRCLATHHSHYIPGKRRAGKVNQGASHIQATRNQRGTADQGSRLASYLQWQGVIKHHLEGAGGISCSNPTFWRLF